MFAPDVPHSTADIVGRVQLDGRISGRLIVRGVVTVGRKKAKLNTTILTSENKLPLVTVELKSDGSIVVSTNGNEE
jgi:hypothetical protein